MWYLSYRMILLAEVYRIEGKQARKTRNKGALVDMDKRRKCLWQRKVENEWFWIIDSNRGEWKEGN